MIGTCLCEKVKYEIKGELPNLYQCHCLLCRKQSGTASNAATFILEDNFSWLTGEDLIASYVKDTGFRSDFCSNCGSAVPNKLRDTNKYWVPAGTLNIKNDTHVVAHLYSHSKVCWDNIPLAGKVYAEMPDFDTLNAILTGNTD